MIEAGSLAVRLMTSSGRKTHSCLCFYHTFRTRFCSPIFCFFVIQDEKVSYASKQVSNKKAHQLKLPFINLEKEGLILESRNVPEKKLVLYNFLLLFLMTCV